MTKKTKTKTAKKPSAKKTKTKKAAAKRGGAPTLVTIGYELANPAAVFNELKAAKVDILADVRAVAASRRPGFSKTQLAAGLDEQGIAVKRIRQVRERGRTGRSGTAADPCPHASA